MSPEKIGKNKNPKRKICMDPRDREIDKNSNSRKNWELGEKRQGRRGWGEKNGYGDEKMRQWDG